MALDDFVSCLTHKFVLSDDTMVEVGKLGTQGAAAYKAIGQVWSRTPPQVKAFIIRSAALAIEYLGVALEAALAALGIVSAEAALAVIIAMAILAGAVLVMEAVESCAAQTLA